MHPSQNKQAGNWFRDKMVKQITQRGIAWFLKWFQASWSFLLFETGTTWDDLKCGSSSYLRDWISLVHWIPRGLCFIYIIWNTTHPSHAHSLWIRQLVTKPSRGHKGCQSITRVPDLMNSFTSELHAHSCHTQNRINRTISYRSKNMKASSLTWPECGRWGWPER